MNCGGDNDVSDFNLDVCFTIQMCIRSFHRTALTSMLHLQDTQFQALFLNICGFPHLCGFTESRYVQT